MLQWSKALQMPTGGSHNLLFVRGNNNQNGE